MQAGEKLNLGDAAREERLASIERPRSVALDQDAARVGDLVALPALSIPFRSELEHCST